MNNLKVVFTSIASAAVVSAIVVTVLAGGAGAGPQGPQGEPGQGGVSNSDVFGSFRIHGAFMQGGRTLATTTGAATALTFNEMIENNILDVTPIIGATTLTLPATTTFPGINDSGDYRTWVVRNATTSAFAITLAAGTGIDLQEPDGQNVVIGQNNFAWLTCYRKLDTDIACLVDESIPAD